MNSSVGKIVAMVGVIVLVVGMIVGMMWVTTSNSEIRLRTQIKAQQTSCTVVFDNTWKIISQKAQVSDKYKEAFKDIYPKLMEGRYGNARGGALLSFITESNPNFDVSLYKDLMNAIEAQRNTFTREQNKLIDLKREHDTLLQTFPSSMFVGSRSTIEIQIVTSGKTKEAFSTGEENDVKL